MLFIIQFSLGAGVTEILELFLFDGILCGLVLTWATLELVDLLGGSCLLFTISFWERPWGFLAWTLGMTTDNSEDIFGFSQPVNYPTLHPWKLAMPNSWIQFARGRCHRNRTLLLTTRFFDDVLLRSLFGSRSFCSGFQNPRLSGSGKFSSDSHSEIDAGEASGSAFELTTASNAFLLFQKRIFDDPFRKRNVLQKQTW